MSKKCITCGEGISREIKDLIELYKEKGIKRMFYRVNGSNWQIVDTESFEIIRKKYKRNKSFEFYGIQEAKSN